MIATARAADEARSSTMVDEGRLRPVVAAMFPLAEGRNAYGPGDGPRRPGKTVPVVRPD